MRPKWGCHSLILGFGENHHWILQVKYSLATYFFSIMLWNPKRLRKSSCVHNVGMTLSLLLITISKKSGMSGPNGRKGFKLIQWLKFFIFLSLLVWNAFLLYETFSWFSPRELFQKEFLEILTFPKINLQWLATIFKVRVGSKYKRYFRQAIFVSQIGNSVELTASLFCLRYWANQ